MQLTINTLEDILNTPAGFVGREPNGTIVLRDLDGIGAVWRRTGSNRNFRPEDITLPLIVLVPATA